MLRYQKLKRRTRLKNPVLLNGGPESSEKVFKVATTKYKFGKGKHGAKAVQRDLPDGEQLVSIGGLRVFILPDGEFWFAKGLEIDYATQGDTLEQAKENFGKGLAETIDLHLQMH